MSDLKYHPLCRLLPALPEDALDRLRDDIAAHGLREPITLLDGLVLDGRSRLTACLMAGVEPQFVDFSGDSPAAFVASKNLHRRHLTESQRAAVAAELAEAMEAEDRTQSDRTGPNRISDFPLGQKSASDDDASGNISGPIGPENQTGPNRTEPDQTGLRRGRPPGASTRTADAATATGATERSTKRARRVKAIAPEVHEAVKAGEITLHAAEQLVAPPKPDDGEQLRASILRRLDLEADILRLCDSPAGRNVKRANAVEALGKLVAAIKGERPALDPVAEIALPPPLDGDDFRAKWREWCAYRRSKRKPVTKAAAEKQVKKLQAAGLLAALAAIDDAIANDYQGVFPERSKAHGGTQRQRIGAGQQYDEAHEGSGRL